MIRLENPYYLYGLLLIPLMVIIYYLWMRWRKKALKKFGDPQVIRQLIPGASIIRTNLKFVVILAAYLFLIIGLANPQIGSRLVEAQRKGVDLMIALDVSNSMMAEDIQPNRLEKARLAIIRLIEELKNDRIGIIVFAGKAYTQLPITTDYAAARMFLSTINTGSVPIQGTAIAEAIGLAARSFSENDHSKAIIVITDGEDHEGKTIEAVKKALENEIRTFTIGMGLPSGGPIPEFNGTRKTGYKKDKEGNTIVTKLNEPMLQEIAMAGNGIYVRANNATTGLRKVFEEINKLEEKEFESKVFTDYEDRFQYFIAISVVLIILELMIAERKSKWAGKLKLFSSKTEKL